MSKPSVTKSDHAALSLVERRFVLEYLVDLNATLAYRRTHPKCKSNKAASVQGSRLLAKPWIAHAVEVAQADWQDRTMITAARVARDIDVAANLDVSECFDADGNLLPIRMMPPYVRRAIQSVEVIKRNITAGDGKVDLIYKIKVIDKKGMHEILARHTGVDKGDGQTQPTVPAFALPADTPGVAVH